MEVYMELSKKTTILFSPDLHRRLAGIAERQGVSLGELVREACEARYGVQADPRRAEAADALGKLSLPVGTVDSMKKESQPAPGDLLP
jgi:predicted DNA-binding protein